MLFQDEVLPVFPPKQSEVSSLGLQVCSEGAPSAVTFSSEAMYMSIGFLIPI